MAIRQNSINKQGLHFRNYLLDDVDYIRRCDCSEKERIFLLIAVFICFNPCAKFCVSSHKIIFSTFSIINFSEETSLISTEIFTLPRLGINLDVGQNKERKKITLSENSRKKSRKQSFKVHFFRGHVNTAHGLMWFIWPK